MNINHFHILLGCEEKLSKTVNSIVVVNCCGKLCLINGFMKFCKQYHIMLIKKYARKLLLEHWNMTTKEKKQYMIDKIKNCITGIF